jgi:acyl carrier protein
VAAARDGAGGEKMLVAYVVPSEREGKAERVAAIRRYLEERLPDYMVPSVFVELEKLPLNHNLKLDRRALPPIRESDYRAQTGEAPFRDPETPGEKAMATLWRRILKIDRIGVDDHFFELGGDSLLAIQLILAVKNEMGVTLDGMDVLRESLAVLAQICSGSGMRRERARSPEAIETFHFGHQASLYGVLHRGTGADRALLICSPVGVESVRSSFVIRQLATRMAAQGVSVLYFDYFGCGDSLGASRVESLGRWESDIVDACEALRGWTKAKQVLGLGVRLGAPLLARASKRAGLSSVAYWDPVSSGSEYLMQLRSSQRRYLLAKDLGRAAREKRPIEEALEFLGTIFSPRALNELRDLALPASPSARVLDLGLDWCDVAHIDQIFPDTGISRQLARLVGEA